MDCAEEQVLLAILCILLSKTIIWLQLDRTVMCTECDITSHCTLWWCGAPSFPPPVICNFLSPPARLGEPHGNAMLFNVKKEKQESKRLIHTNSQQSLLLTEISAKKKKESHALEKCLNPDVTSILESIKPIYLDIPEMKQHKSDFCEQTPSGALWTECLNGCQSMNS